MNQDGENDLKQLKYVSLATLVFGAVILSYFVLKKGGMWVRSSERFKGFKRFTPFRKEF